MATKKFAAIFGYKDNNSNELFFESTAIVNYNKKDNTFVIKSGDFEGCNQDDFSILTGPDKFIYGNQIALKSDKKRDIAIYIFDNKLIKKMEKNRNQEEIDVYVYMATKLASIKLTAFLDTTLVSNRLSNKQSFFNLATPQVVKKQLNIKDETKVETKEETSEEEETEELEEFDISKVDVKEISSKIKKKIVGQDEAIDTLVNNIYCNQLLIDDLVDDNGDFDPSEMTSRITSILLDGSTGTGKTAIAKEIARSFNLPIEIVSANSFSETGYVGASVTDILQRLYEKTDGDIELAERGIVFLDEIDKLANNDDFAGKGMKKGVQEELLQFIGGGKYEIEIKENIFEDDEIDFEPDDMFDTSKLTFILSGAFTELKEAKKKEVEKSNKPLGFGGTNNKKDSYTINAQDYIDYGLMREFFGRVKVLSYTKDYSKEDLKKILLESEISPLKNFEKNVKLHGYNGIVYEDEFVDRVVDEAYEMKTGARSLQTVMSGIQNLILNDLINKTYDQNLPIKLTTDMLDKYKKKFVRKLN